nr:MAG TPA: homing endonuclease [Caudoviricetes sp.]
MKEFKKIKSLKFMFEINNDGTIIRNIKSKKEYKPTLNSNGDKYQRYTVDINNKKYMVHRLVAEAWCPHPDTYSELDVHHLDNNSLNNNYKNLKWLSKSEHQKIHSKNRDTSIFNEYRHSEENKNRLRENAKTAQPMAIEILKKPVKGIDIRDGHIRIFDSLHDAMKKMRDLNLTNSNNVSHIMEVCQHKRKVAYKHKWEYI